MSNVKEIKGFLRILLTVFMVTIITTSFTYAEEVVISNTSDIVSVDVSVDKTEVEPGGELTFTYVTTSHQPYTSLTVYLDRMEGTTLSDTFSVSAAIPEGTWEEYYPNYGRSSVVARRINVILENIPNAIETPGQIFTLKLKVSENAVIGQKFSLNVNVTSDKQTTKVASEETFDIEIVDSASDPGIDEPGTPAYTITPVAYDTEKYVGDIFTVSAVVTSDQADAGLAAVDAVLNYDKNLVRPVKAEPGVITGGSDNSVTYDADAGTGKIFAYGNSVSAGEPGVTVATYTFEAIAPGEASFSIADGAKVGQSGNSADIDAYAGPAAVVKISEIPDTLKVIPNTEYKGAPKGYQVLEYTANEIPAEGSAYFYGDSVSPLYYAGENAEGKHVFLGFVDATLTNATLAGVTEKTSTGGYVSLKLNGDINLNDVTNAIDSLIAYDLSTGNENYLEDGLFEALGEQSRLEADVNRDGKVDAADARAAMYLALGIEPSGEASE